MRPNKLDVRQGESVLVGGVRVTVVAMMISVSSLQSVIVHSCHSRRWYDMK